MLPPPPIGAGEDEEIELNPGKEPPTPVDPTKIDNDQGLPDAQIPARPIGAQEEPTDVVLYRDATDIAGTSQTAEPNIGANGQDVFMVWNWGAARSSDGGVTYQYIDPYKQFATGEDKGYCCDQLAQYVPGYNMWVWVLQTITARDDRVTHAGGNRIRLKVALGMGNFLTAYDLPSSGSGLTGDVWYDQPKIGSSNGHLFVSVNAYTPDETFVASVVYRLSLADMAASQATTPSCFTTLNQPNAFDHPTFALVPVRRGADTMSIAAHHSNYQLAVWEWPDTDAQPVRYLANTSLNGNGGGYPANYPFTCARTGTTGTATDWCRNSGDRIMSAWAAGGQIGFAWNASQEAPTSDRPYPSIWAVLIDKSRLATCALGGCVTAIPKIRNKTYAFEYPAIAPNSRGDLGMVFLYGGGALPQSCGFAARAVDAAPTAEWEFSADYFDSDRDPVEPSSGDYLNAVAGPGDGTWMAGCMTNHKTNLDSQRPATVHYSYFGRRSDTPSP